MMKPNRLGIARIHFLFDQKMCEQLHSLCVRYEIFISPQVILDHHVTFANILNRQQNNCYDMYETLILNINAVRLSKPNVTTQCRSRIPNEEQE